MGGAKEFRSRRTRPLDCPLAENDIALYVRRRLEVQLSVKVAVIADLVSLTQHAMNELGPALGVRSENEESGFDVVFCERVENARCRFRIRTIVKCEGNATSITRKL